VPGVGWFPAPISRKAVAVAAVLVADPRTHWPPPRGPWHRRELGVPSLGTILWAAFILTIFNIADMRAASMIVGLTLAQVAWYPASR